jgi:hypothetical protein
MNLDFSDEEHAHQEAKHAVSDILSRAPQGHAAACGYLKDQIQEHKKLQEQTASELSEAISEQVDENCKALQLLQNSNPHIVTSCLKRVERMGKTSHMRAFK